MFALYTVFQKTCDHVFDNKLNYNCPFTKIFGTRIGESTTVLDERGLNKPVYTVIRRRRSLAVSEGDVYVLVRVLFFFVFFFLLTRLLSNGWMDFHQILRQKTSFAVLFVKQIFGPKTSIFERKFRLRRLRTAAAWKRGGILGKLKQTL